MNFYDCADYLMCQRILILRIVYNLLTHFSVSSVPRFLQTTVLARAGGLLFCVSATNLIAAAERLW